MKKDCLAECPLRNLPPNQPMTRAMFVKVLANNTANFTPYDGSTPFTDVRPGDWYCDAVNWAYQNVIVNGVSETRFDPGANVTRGADGDHAL